MQKGNFLLRVVSAIILLTALNGCVAHQRQTSKMAEFPQLYEENPASILVLPPINESTDAEAKDYYSTTVPIPLMLHGYYVFPYELTAEILKQEGIYDTELLLNMPMEKFYEYFGADAVLFTVIRKWDVRYLVFASSLTVSVDCEIKSTHTSNTLWKYNGEVVVDLTANNNNSGGGMAGLVAQVVATAINTATADYVDYARIANDRAMAALPYGRYHPLYKKDMEQKILDQSPGGKTAE